MLTWSQTTVRGFGIMIGRIELGMILDSNLLYGQDCEIVFQFGTSGKLPY